MTMSIAFDINALSIILFSIGFVLLVIEMFQPGFGVFGISGIIVLIIDIFITAKSFSAGLIMFAVYLLIFAVIFVIGLILFSNGRFPKVFVLKDSSTKQDGYTSAGDMTDLIGKHGTAVTPLRPAGCAEICERRVDVVTNGTFVDKDSKIVVTEVMGNRIVVKKDEE